MKCLNCKRTIPHKRLAAVPNARYCVSCQGRVGVVEIPIPDRVLAISCGDCEGTNNSFSFRHQRRLAGVLGTSMLGSNIDRKRLGQAEVA